MIKIRSTHSSMKGFTLVELMVVIAIIAIIGAIAIPNLIQSRLSANEATAITCLKAYSTAQITFHVGKNGANAANTNTGFLGYCDNYRNLFYGNPLSDSNANLLLITKQFADAFARAPGSYSAGTNNSPTSASATATHYQGYLFAEPKELIAIDSAFGTNYGLLGVPMVPRTTGENAYWIGQQGTVWITAVPVGTEPSISIEMDTPNNPALSGSLWHGM